jgi:uncharacterized membrane protein
MVRLFVRLLLAALFLIAGTIHLARPAVFEPVMPPWIPWHGICIKISGMLELLGSVGLLTPERTIQRATGWGLVLLLIAVFPVNIHMAMASIRIDGYPSHLWMLWARLLLQPVLIVAVIWVARLQSRNVTK